jgi:hypothetical protein
MRKIHLAAQLLLSLITWLLVVTLSLPDMDHYNQLRMKSVGIHRMIIRRVEDKSG